MSRPTPTRRRTGRRFLLLYLFLLAASWGVRHFAVPSPSPATRDGIATRRFIRLQGVRLSWLHVPPSSSGPDASPTLPVMLIHGSPGQAADLRRLFPGLSGRRRILAPDLPGFGRSDRDIPDYSIAAHARYLLELLDQEGIERVHLVGFSMGGGVALELYDLAPERIASVTLLSSIGVQEMELFGDYRMNHLVHGAQLALLKLILDGIPHFGLLDGGMLDIPYARNFYDSDQRPLRGILIRLDPPTLIYHGRNDPLVPLAAAKEHARLVPQSVLEVVDGDHFMVFTRGDQVARAVSRFLDRVEAGREPTRAQADPARIAASLKPFDPSTVPEANGVALLVLMLLIALATLVSEDLTCIATGLIIVQGRIGFLPGVLACFAGIFFGDLLLYLAGRWIGRPALSRRPLRWFLSAERVEQGSRWFRRRGPIVIGLSRFTPGTRLPTYFAAGMFRTGFWRFSLYFFVAAGLWTPILVAFSMFAGSDVLRYLSWMERYGVVGLIASAFLILLVVRFLAPLLTWRGRRRMKGRFLRITRWEFWPPWLFYPPVVLHILFLGLRYRCLTLFTAANPAMPAGGFISESKSAILDGLIRGGSGDSIARYLLLPGGARDENFRQARRFMERESLEFPVVLKPDIGQRGSGVRVVRGETDLKRCIESTGETMILQEYVPGVEFGVFWYKLPGEPEGVVFSITEKVIPEVTGDGRRSLERLILEDRRAVAMAEVYLAGRPDAADTIPRAGERVPLTELGTHCRGAVFLDGSRVNGPGLAGALEEISGGYEGFWFGRYDLRVEDPADLALGRRFKVIELNGVTSEATHIYDPKTGLFEAWRVLRKQWSVAFEIGARNRKAGVRPATVRELVRLILRYRSESSGRE